MTGCPRGVAPLSEENILVFATGPLTGTLTPTSGRSVVCTKSPLTGLWLDSNCGGTFGPELKQAGFDYVVIRGRAAEPVILVIENGRAQIRPAGGLWGRDTFVVQAGLKEELGSGFKVATIGPAGEAGVLYSSIIAEYRAFGRGGAGAVMGAKNLKALAVRGTGPVRVADPEGYLRVCREAFNELAINPEAGGGRQDYGTNQILSAMNLTGLHPVKNFQKGVFAGAEKINEETISSLYVRHKACAACPIYCSKISRVKEGPYAGAFVEGPEYENAWAFGAHCENTDLGAVVQAEYLCDLYGLDSISTGSTIGFLMECFEKGLLAESEIGFPLPFGDHQAMIRAVHLIGRAEGPGRLWGRGVRRLGEEIPGAAGAAMHVKGLELPAYDPRGSFGMALAFATSDRGGCHLRSWPIGGRAFGHREPDGPLLVRVQGRVRQGPAGPLHRPQLGRAVHLLLPRHVHEAGHPFPWLGDRAGGALLGRGGADHGREDQQPGPPLQPQGRPDQRRRPAPRPLLPRAARGGAAQGAAGGFGPDDGGVLLLPGLGSPGPAG